MNDETIFSPNDSEQQPLNQKQSQPQQNTMVEEPSQPKVAGGKKEGRMTAAAAGIGGVAGAAAGSLIPKLVFPSAPKEDDSSAQDEEPEEVEIDEVVVDQKNDKEDEAVEVEDLEVEDEMLVEHAAESATLEAAPVEVMSLEMEVEPEDESEPEEIIELENVANENETTTQSVIQSTSGTVIELDEVVFEPTSTAGELDGHIMDVATSVDDSMSFNQAFAAARREVGPGGLFVWHGNTYGTYYGNEWNAMTPDEKDQYWTDVHHTTSHLNDVAEEAQEPVEVEQGGSGTLVLNEDDVIVEVDMDGDGNPDIAVVDANDNDMADLLVDTDGDGSYDMLIVDPSDVHLVDEVVVNHDEMFDQGDLDMDVPPIEEIEPEIPDDGLLAENPDVDLLASVDFDPDITIDNNMDMDEFV